MWSVSNTALLTLIAFDECIAECISISFSNNIAHSYIILCNLASFGFVLQVKKSVMASCALMAPVCLLVLTAMVWRTVQEALMSKTAVLLFIQVYISGIVGFCVVIVTREIIRVCSCRSPLCTLYGVCVQKPSTVSVPVSGV